MAVGIIIHITVGSEKRTEFFSDERIRIGSDETSDLQIHTPSSNGGGMWFDLENADGLYRITDFDASLNLTINQRPIRRFIAIADGDVIDVNNSNISFSFFSLETKSPLITTNRDQPHISRFIQDAALESATSAKRAMMPRHFYESSSASSFARSRGRPALSFSCLRSRLSPERCTSALPLATSCESRKQAEQQSAIISKLEEKLDQTSGQLGDLDKSNKDLMKTVSLAPNLRVEYGGGVCLIVGVYDLVEKKSGKVLRYADPQALRPNPYEPTQSEDPARPAGGPQIGLTTEGNGSTVEYDFIGTGFHVGGGYIVTNRHVVQPWEEDDQVKQMMQTANGRARVKRLVIYFPNFAAAVSAQGSPAWQPRGHCDRLDRSGNAADRGAHPADRYRFRIGRHRKNRGYDGLSQRTRPPTGDGRR